MISVEEAFELVQKNIIPTTKTQKQSIIKSLGFVLAETVVSPINMPPFRQSAMDGYALNMHTKNNYTIIDEVKAGDGHHPILKEGEAVRIFTGSAVPDTANTVIMQEKVTVEGTILTINEAFSINENIRPLGEQVEKRAIALHKGSKLSPAAIGYLTTLGIPEIKVFTKPSIAIVTTGNELVEAGQELPYGKIYESNSGMLQTALQSLGFDKVTITKVKDDFISTKKSLEKAISENDLVIISGGISVGDYDFVGKALLELGIEQIFYKVKQKPGKPLFFGKMKNKPVFALPGNPASALSNFYVYVQPSLQKLSGNLDFSLTRLKANLTADYFKKGDRAQFLKASVKNGEVTILEGQSSAMLYTFAIANTFVYVPAEVNTFSKGDSVEVIMLPV
ncbi:MAG: molybdopterin molybdotransferase MoeA [Flavobacteriaceae bacterium]|nr:molybdopterin molybdotransferase MoeA [Flavobacteriaceae bacterium]